MLVYRDILAAAKSLQSCPTVCDPIDGSVQKLEVKITEKKRKKIWNH